MALPKSQDKKEKELQLSILLLAKRFNDFQKELTRIMEIKKGEKGDSPTDTQLLRLIKPLIPQVKDGKDGKSIVGPRGPEGKKGDKGDSIVGPKGDDGKNGKDGEKGDMPDHRWNGTKLSFQKPDGTWGKEVDLKGDKGNSYSLLGGGFSQPAMNLHLIDDETPVGTINGTNTIFTINHIPSPASSLKVFLNGQRMRKTEDYTYANKTITFLIAPPTSSILLVDYRI